MEFAMKSSVSIESVVSVMDATPPPRIELRRVSYNARLSQETPAFAADVWIDGVKCGEARNEGTGGPHHIWPPDLRRRLDEHARTLPPLPPMYGMKDPLPMDAELLIGEILERHLAGKDLQRALRTKYLLVGADGRLYQCSKKGPKPKEPVLNDMPFEQALVLYAKAGAR